MMCLTFGPDVPRPGDPASDLAVSYDIAPCPPDASSEDRMLFWVNEPCLPRGSFPVLNFAGWIAPDVPAQRRALQALLDDGEMLDRADGARLFLVVCRLTGQPLAPLDIAGHRRNSARNFNRMVGAFVLGKPGYGPGVDKAIYLYEAEDEASVQAMLASDPMTQKTAWDPEVFDASVRKAGTRREIFDVIFPSGCPE